MSDGPLSGTVQKFLRAICPDHLVEEIEGDLIQTFERDRKSIGIRRAKLRLVWNAIRYVRPGIILRNRISTKRGNFMMLHYAKFAFRSFMKDKFFATLNLFGLALAISVGLILLLTLQSDFTYDQHFQNHERIYRISSQYGLSNSEELSGATARELAPILKDVYPEIETMTRIEKLDHQLVSNENHQPATTFYEDGVIQTDSLYFTVFSHTFLAGDIATCLADPYQAIVTETIALKYFGTIDVLNKVLVVDGIQRRVSGVIADQPENTHLKFDLIVSGLPEIRPTWESTMEGGKPISLVFWNPDVYTYAVLPEGYDRQRFYSRFQPIYDEYFKEVGDEAGDNCSLVLQPLTEIHFSASNDSWPHGSMGYLYVFSGIGLMIILLACVNYMNLSTARAMHRATEVAVRKISGLRRRDLALSFLTESLILSFLSLVVAIVVVVLVLKFTPFNQLTGKTLIVDFIGNPTLVIGSVAIAGLIGLASGLYPALYLPAIPVVKALKGAYKNSNASHRFRRVLITTQFFISIFVVACTLLMRDQINYVQSRELGFDKENVLVVPIEGNAAVKNLQAIKNELLRDARISSVTSSGTLMGMSIGGNVMFGEGESGMQQHEGVLAHFVGDDYLTTMGVPLLAGRDFKPGDNVDEDGMYIANEAVVKLMGWGDNAIGKKVSFWEGANAGVVIGVVKDFHASSLHREIEPMFIVKGHWDAGFLQIRLNGNDIPGAIEFVRNGWSRYTPNQPFDYFFLDERFNEQYKEDVIQNRMLSGLAYICIVISLLGIIGLSAFAAVQRTKEIGVRKVLGARVLDIILLLSKDVLVLVAFAAILAIPLSGWAIGQWLESFAYRTEINLLLCLIVAIAALAFVFIVIALQSLRTARANPVDSLKYE